MLGVKMCKKKKKSPTGQEVSGLSSLALAECIPVVFVAPLTQ